MAKIDEKEIHWWAYGNLDPSTRTFEYNGTYYRAVKLAAKDYILSLFQSGIIDQLNNDKLIPETTISDIDIDGYAFAIKQQTEYFNITPTHFCPVLMKEAAITYLNIYRILNKTGHVLFDGHPYNFIVQENCRPKWCDIGSIYSRNSNNKSLFGLSQFIETFIFPLLLRQKTHVFGKLSRFYFANCCSEVEFNTILNIEKNEINNIRYKNIDHLIEQLLELVDRIDFNFPDTMWGNYHQINHSEASLSDALNINSVSFGKSDAREVVIKRLLNAFRPKHVLDVGANHGIFSIMAAQTGAEVLAYEPDEQACCKCFDNIKQFSKELKTKISCKVALASFDDLNLQQKPDCVLALALTHHLFFTNFYKFDAIARVLAKNTNDILLTEFMPNGLGIGEPHLKVMPSDYSLELFIQELKKHFVSVEIMHYAGIDYRILLICRKKS